MITNRPVPAADHTTGGHTTGPDTPHARAGVSAAPGRWSRLVAHPERGASVSVMAAGLLVATAVFLGLVIDGGAKITASNKANATAQEAARAGVQAATTSGSGGVVPGASPTALGGSGASVNVARAAAAAQSYLAAAGVSGTATPAGGDSLRVTVTIAEPTKVLSLIGVSSYTVTGTADARILYARS
jgi:hypothetical protein